jgi:hypothetical protein
VLVPIEPSTSLPLKKISNTNRDPIHHSPCVPSCICNGMTMSSSVTANGRKSEFDEHPPMTSRSPFSVPAPVKRLFDAFPLITLPANELPLRSQQARKTKGHALFCWSTAEDVAARLASFNPMCLRWQVSCDKDHIYVATTDEAFVHRHI